ncbi:transglycosylase domain-containing protein [Albidovulum sediminicola]|uniref:peptidoglycan glycosyltransferase n=1 Tax=Albidovulum sediminicola TaxID=2984331 RepID=A0ABT2YZ28_9RHOB|nr:PBP1A family penicillin-binding protein [Defluviimonas sp. WL0075]MCV2864128.1 PBP1A family penicillin-binding protein [Defluviimonas sp. WL0075]
MSSKGGRRSPLVADKRYGKEPPKPKAAAPKRTPAKRRRKRSSWPVRLVTGTVGYLSRTLWAISWRVGFVVASVLALATLYFYAQLQPLGAYVDARTKGSVTLLDRDGQVYAWRGETFGGQIDAASVSPYLKNAVVATEDKRFYGHLGISPRGIAGAIRINLAEGRGPLEGNGGSTITQQVAKLLCLGVAYDPSVWKSEGDYEDDCRRGGVWRKIKEVPFALALEAKFSKDEILTLYLNRAYLGAGARGFEAAAQRYFGKSANSVDPAEAAMLAGLLKAPTRYAPTANLKRSQDRAAVVLGLMHDQDYLTDKEYNQAMAQPARLSKAAAARAGGYFADWVMESGPAFLTSDTTEDVIIQTTLDQRIQKSAEEALAQIFSNRLKAGSKAQAAIVVMSADGAVRAMVGGRDAQANGAFNRATQAKRQTGSTFKPFVYAAALDMGWNLNTIVEDAPLTIHVPGSGDWSPKNYERDYRGPITLTQALAHSVNTATVRVSEAVGRDAVRGVANNFGFEADLAEGPALALGVSETTLLEMTGAYAGILNGGTSVRPYGMLELRLRGEDTALAGQEGGLGERVISEEAARELTYMMHQVIESGTGRRARLEGRQAAGKTGTTQAARDAWFIGFTADYVTGVWMGYDDNTPLTGVTGGGLPAEIWHEVMVRVEDGLPARPLPMANPVDYPAEPVYETYAPGAPATGRGQGRPRPSNPEGFLVDLLGAILRGGN